MTAPLTAMKVDSRRFYHHADRLGIMVLQDMPRCAMVTGRSMQWFTRELQAMVRLLRNHASVVQFQVFNEGGGGDGSCSYVCRQVQAVRAQAADLQSRRVIDISGGGQADCMCQLPPSLCTCPGRSSSCPALNWTGRGCGCGCSDGWDAHQYPLPNAPLASRTMIACADEYGATRGAITGHEWYASPRRPGYDFDSRAWVDNFTTFSDLLRGMIARRGLSSAIYTQVSDVEGEINGIQTYDRVLKLSPTEADATKALNYRLWYHKTDDKDARGLPPKRYLVLGAAAPTSSRSSKSSSHKTNSGRALKLDDGTAAPDTTDTTSNSSVTSPFMDLTPAPFDDGRTNYKYAFMVPVLLPTPGGALRKDEGGAVIIDNIDR